MHSIVARLLFAAIAATGASASLAQVTPPPLPPGSNLVRPDAGLNDDERKRYVRAHHHKGHHKKDMTRDDSVYGPDKAKDAPGQGGGNNAGGNKNNAKKK
jgi:hypothetical protein